MQTALQPALAIALLLALVWFPAQLIVTVWPRQRRTQTPYRLSIYRAMMALGWAALAFNLMVSYQIFSGQIAISFTQGWALPAALLVVWTTFWSRFAVILMGKKRRINQA